MAGNQLLKLLTWLKLVNCIWRFLLAFIGGFTSSIIKPRITLAIFYLANAMPTKKNKQPTDLIDKKIKDKIMQVYGMQKIIE